MKLEQFSKERELNNQKLNEINSLSGSLYSFTNPQTKRSLADDIESLITIMDAEDCRDNNGITPRLLDLESVHRNELLSCDALSDGQQDNSLLMLEKEWLESQKNQLENSNITMLIDENEEVDDLKKIDKRTFVKTQKIEGCKEDVEEG